MFFFYYCDARGKVCIGAGDFYIQKGDRLAKCSYLANLC